MSLPVSVDHKKRGAALIIVLALLVVLSGVVVAYLSRTSTDRQLAHETYNENRSDILARGALDVVVADLKQEISLGSTATTSNGYTIYTPLGNANMLPVVSGTPSPTPTPSSNMVRRSWFNDANLPVRSRASLVNSTTDVSLNGRSVSTPRWNRHYLIPRLNASSTAIDSTPVATFTAPDWVLVTRAGPTPFPSWNAAVKDSTPTNAAYVIGRYAYAIYDEGGLLDVNVAGFPSPAPSPATYVQAIGRKGSVAYADLTSLPTSTASPAPTFPPMRVNDIVGWRNFASTQPSGSIQSNSFVFNATSAQSFVNLVASNRGFLTVATASPTPSNGWTDQAFTTRQQLLAFRTAPGDTGFSQNALQYFGTFSRELNRPTWTPTLNAKDMGAANNGPANVYAYKDNAANPAATPINRNLAAVRVPSPLPNPTPSPRPDGSPFVVGEPLIKERFALTRINGLGPAGIVTTVSSTLKNGVLSPADSGTVQRDFGLQWDSTNNRWLYVGASGSTVQSSIERLDQVAAEFREPNFFEVLKAVILGGSIGLATTGNTFVIAEAKYSNPDHQIIQIGANIIDAWDIDNVPTFIAFNDPTTSTIYEIAGIENLPYINKLVYAPIMANHGSSDDFSAWLVPSLWNPHQNASAGPATAVRFAMIAGTMTATVTDGGSNTYVSSPAVTGSLAGPYFQVAASKFGVPTPPEPSPSPGNETAPSFPQSSPTPIPGSISATEINTSYEGITFCYRIPDTTTHIRLHGQGNISATWPTFTNATFVMQIFVNGGWKAYQTWTGCANSTPLTCHNTPSAHGGFMNGFFDPEFITLDPRTVRLGIWGNDAADANSNDFTIGPEVTMDEGVVLESTTGLRPQPSAGSTPPVFPTTGKTYLYANNDSGNSAAAGDRYSDLDGVTRRGDWTTEKPSPTPGKTPTKTIMYTSPSPLPTPVNSQDRTRNPSQPFQSVAELGQVFRDQPWKTLSFSNANSADVGLLDAFTLQDVPMVAGRTSLNTRQSAVLIAMLSQVTRNLAAGQAVNSVAPDNLPTYTAADINTIVNDPTGGLVALTSAAPMMNKAELVTRLMEDTTLNNLWKNPGNNDPYNKEAREAIIRALSDSTQTRTWNLMIDVIAQSGRYPPNATSLANFVVEGEKRYWLHVAIDRFTGEVIDQQLEAVYE